MEEKVLQNKKNGMIVLVVTSLLYLAAVAGCIFGGMMVSDGYSPASGCASAVSRTAGFES